jgi:peptidoglycan/xylan/chitin deacetylase (PgdA/CDA1 family)
VILMYHRIATETFDPWGHAVEERRFVEQIEWLSRSRTVMTLAEVVDRHRVRTLPADAIAITFDDGYACALRAAAQLERLNLPATVFIAPELIERGQEFWWDELANIVIEFEGSVLRFDGEEIPMPRGTGEDKSWLPCAKPATERQELFQSIWASLRTKPPVVVDSAMAQLRGQSHIAAPRESHRPLSTGEIRAMKSARIAFGSHALTHPSLPALNKVEKAREIKGSRPRCTELSGEVPRAFAYPYGDLDAESMRLVHEAGFDCACSTEGDFVGSRTDRFALPRLQVGNWDVARFADMLSGQ